MVFFVGGADRRMGVDLTKNNPRRLETRISTFDVNGKTTNASAANGKISAGNGGHWPSGSFSGVCGLAATA